MMMFRPLGTARKHLLEGPLFLELPPHYKPETPLHRKDTMKPNQIKDAFFPEIFFPEMPLTKVRLCHTIIKLLKEDDLMSHSRIFQLCFETLENEKVIRTSKLKLPLLIGSLKYDSSKRILEDKLKGNL